MADRAGTSVCAQRVAQAFQAARLGRVPIHEHIGPKYSRWFAPLEQGVLAVIECKQEGPQTWSDSTRPGDLHRCWFLSGSGEGESSEAHPRPLRQVDPITFSETLAFVEALGFGTAVAA